MIKIQEIQPDELTEDVLDILTEAFKHPRLNLDTAKIYMEIRALQDVHTFVIYLDEKVIGTASLIRELKLFGDNNPYIAHIEDVAIHKDYRGFGYGKQLITHMIEWSKTQSCYKIVLFCSNDNVKFYKKCGFRHTSNLMRKDLES